MYGRDKKEPEPSPRRAPPLSSAVQHFLVKTVRAKKASLLWDKPSIPGDIRRHDCPVRPWYAQYEVFGVEWLKLYGKKAFRVINKKSNK
jgi:hypothetical protein